MMKIHNKLSTVRALIWIMTTVLMLLAVIHYLDTRAGAIQSRDFWLVQNYIVVAVIAVITTFICGILLTGNVTAKAASAKSASVKAAPSQGKCPGFSLETTYLIAAALFGLLYLWVLPPMSAPDEVSHYISAYQLSNQLMGKGQKGEDGKVRIREEDWFIEDTGRTYGAYLSAEGDLATDAVGAEGAVVLGQVLTEETYKSIHGKGIFSKESPRMEGSSGIALSNHNPVRTTPLAYAAPAVGITIARLLNLNSLMLVMFGRLMNLILFITGTYFAMRKLPFGKTVLFGVALLPMTMNLSASFSYDGFIMAGIFYMMASCLHLAYRAERVKAKDVLVMALIMAAVGPCKMVYTVFMGLCLLIPVKKFGGWKPWLISAFSVLAAWTAVMIIINGQTVTSYATETENYITWAGEAGYSLTMLIHRPVHTIQMFYQTLLWQGEHYHLTMIGAYLGNVDLVLDVPYLVIVFFSVGLVLLTLRKPGETIEIHGGRRIWIMVLCLICSGMLLLSMFLAWTPLSSRVICGVQGRYFLPILPVFLLACKNNRIVLTKNADRSILYLMCCANGYILLRLYSIVSMRL